MLDQDSHHRDVLSLVPTPSPCTDTVLKDGGLFAMQALPLSLLSADLYVRFGLELDFSKLSQVVAL